MIKYLIIYMKSRYTYNRYGVYPNKSENDVLLMEEKNNLLTNHNK